MTTRLEVINLILDELGIHHVADEKSNHPDVLTINTQLDSAIRSLLIRGWWFNTLESVSMPVQPSGFINVGVNVLHVEILDYVTRQQVVKRGNRLYNRVDNTYKFTAPIVATQYIDMGWDDLPHNAQQQVRYRAAAETVRSKLSDLVRARELYELADGHENELSSDEMRAMKYSKYDNQRIANTRAKLRRRY